MSRDNTRIEDYSVDRSVWELTFISIYSLHLRMASLLRRQVVIPLLILLVLTAPFSWQAYTRHQTLSHHAFLLTYLLTFKRKKYPILPFKLFI